MKIDTGTDELLCELKERVAVVSLNKPEKKNALGDILTPALREILLKLESNPDVGCVMITGSGNAFCSGGDVSGMGGGSKETRSVEDRVTDLTERQETLTKRLFELTKPTVAALPGVAAGAGLSIALACDLRVACESAFVTTAFANIGLSGDYGASWFLPRLVGLSRAKQLFFTAERIDAHRGLDIGLIDKVFPDKSFRNDAFEYARAIANGPTMALGLMKKNLNSGVNQELSASLAMEAEHLIKCAGSDESIEAIKAFMGKRKPLFHQ
jgi:enoyl-CoA hydratase/carnithine racemase